jgi:SAM-dependent methyltransferase
MPETATLKDWFNSSYYQLLSEEENEQQALFIDELLKRLQPQKNSRMLMTACGTGKYSKVIADKGFDVTGVDYSFKNIHQAKSLESENLHFFQHDLRLPFWINYFDYAFNLFGKFGYFNTLREHDNSIRSIAQSLLPNCLFILDYINVHFEEANIENEQEKNLGDVHFIFEMTDNEETFSRHIKVRDAESTKEVFTETIQKFSIGDFTDMFAYQGLQVQEVYGDYEFNHYDIHKSPRLILIAEKIKRG